MSAPRDWVRALDRRLGSPLGRAARRLRHAGLPSRPDVRLPIVELGSDYGGFPLHPDGLGPGCVVYSFGVGEDASFDLALLERFGVELHAFDPTPRSIAWVESQAWPEGFHFHPVGVAGHDGTARFHAPADPEWVSHSVIAPPAGDAPAIEVPVRRVASLAAELGHERLALLKMDVEGAEYAVLEDLLAHGPAVDQILVEFHHRMPGVGLGRTREAIARLRRAGYGVAAFSPSREEWAFVHRRVGRPEAA